MNDAFFPEEILTILHYYQCYLIDGEAQHEETKRLRPESMNVRIGRYSGACLAQFCQFIQKQKQGRVRSGGVRRHGLIQVVNSGTGASAQVSWLRVQSSFFSIYSLFHSQQSSLEKHCFYDLLSSSLLKNFLLALQ